MLNTNYESFLLHRIPFSSTRKFIHATSKIIETCDQSSLGCSFRNLNATINIFHISHLNSHLLSTSSFPRWTTKSTLFLIQNCACTKERRHPQYQHHGFRLSCSRFLVLPRLMLIRRIDTILLGHPQQDGVLFEQALTPFQIYRHHFLL